MVHEIASRIPPLEWYRARAVPEEGITRIFLGSDSFYGMDTSLKQAMGEWKRWNGEHLGELGGEVLNFKGDAETLIREVTGFYPEVLTAYIRRLTEIYKGQSMGPFPFPVDWTDK